MFRLKTYFSSSIFLVWFALVVKVKYIWFTKWHTKGYQLGVEESNLQTVESLPWLDWYVYTQQKIKLDE